MEDERGPAMIPGRQAAPARPKRFYERAAAGERADGFALLLDGRLAKTPAKRDVVLPSRALADAVAAEWDSQREFIDPAVMPLTRLCNTAIDGVAAQMDAFTEEVRTYLGSDLLVYRAAEPPILVATQAEAWDPVLAWARDAFGARFILAEGIGFVEQPPAALAAMGATITAVAGDGPAAPFRLAGLHVMTTLTGSALLSLAVFHARITPAEAWSAAHVDETFQESRWGADAEALVRRERRWADMAAAASVGLLAVP